MRIAIRDAIEWDAVALGAMPYGRIDDDVIQPAVVDFCLHTEGLDDFGDVEAQVDPTLDENHCTNDDDIPLDELWPHLFSTI